MKAMATEIDYQKDILEYAEKRCAELFKDALAAGINPAEDQDYQTDYQDHVWAVTDEYLGDFIPVETMQKIIDQLEYNFGTSYADFDLPYSEPENDDQEIANMHYALGILVQRCVEEGFSAAYYNSLD